MNKPQYAVKFLKSIDAITPSDWNDLVDSHYPFLQHEFLAALEQSGSVTLDTGWQPQHLIIHNEQQELIACMPLYLKTHSWGEYVFDWAWADAYQRHGLHYYPKLVSAIPFTPATGSRICISPLINREEILELIIQSVIDLATQRQCSGWHILFPETELSQVLANQHSSQSSSKKPQVSWPPPSLPQRVATQFHWFNRDYNCFDDFLALMTSRKRKNIAKERRKVSQQNISHLNKTGTEITKADWELFYQYYHMTYLKRSGRQGYLSQEFFTSIGETLPESVMMSIAYLEREGEQKPIAAALYFKDNSTLYGRYWGCLEEYEFLHFETCYYQGIDYCIQHKLDRFDAGAQGEHKIQRGFEPIETYSNHWIQHEGFQQAIGDFLTEEKKGNDTYINQCQESLPFK